MDIRDYVIDFTNCELDLCTGKGIIYLMKDDDDTFELVDRKTFDEVINGKRNDYSLNWVSFTFEDDLEYNAYFTKFLVDKEIPRTSIDISTIFYDVESLYKCLKSHGNWMESKTT